MAFRLTVIKATPFRAEAEEEWTNSYYFSGTTPADASAWSTLCQAVFAAEGQFMVVAAGRQTHLVRGYGYAPGSDVAEWVGDFTAGGTSPGILPLAEGFSLVPAGPQPLPVAVLLRWECGLSSHTGKPRYIMKYIHGAPFFSSGGDAVPSLESNGTIALASYTDGTLPGAVVLCAPDGTHATAGVVRPYFTTHQIKRRGKRPRRGA